MLHAPRIISLLPSATEIICALGLADLLVAVTHECDYPSVVLGKPQITRSRLRPDMSSGEIDDAVGPDKAQELLDNARVVLRWARQIVMTAN